MSIIKNRIKFDCCYSDEKLEHADSAKVQASSSCTHTQDELIYGLETSTESCRSRKRGCTGPEEIEKNKEMKESLTEILEQLAKGQHICLH